MDSSAFSSCDYRRSFCSLLAAWAMAAAWIVTASAAPAASPLEELETLSGLGELDPDRLRNGEVISGRGKGGDFARGAYVESCYFVRAPLATVGSALLHWDPSQHKETGVEIRRDYRWPAAPEVFRALNLNAAWATDRGLVDQTREVLTKPGAENLGELHLAPSDLNATRNGSGANGDISDFWRGVLRSRSDAFGNGGLAAVPGYTAGGTEINARAEFRSLLKMTPNIAAHFSPLAETRPLVAGAATSADEAGGYWAQVQMRGSAQLAAGLLCARKSPASWQVLDTTYFTSGTYYLSIDLYQLWPWENGTLVWQVDYISAPFRSYAIGLDKAFAAREMLKDTGQTIRLFRRDVEQQAQAQTSR